LTDKKLQLENKLKAIDKQIAERNQIESAKEKKKLLFLSNKMKILKYFYSQSTKPKMH